MPYLIALALGYLFGTSNMAYYIARLKNADLRAGGSGNLGASNATILLGWRAGVSTALHDIEKSVLAVLIVKLLFPDHPHAAVAAGVASVLGHVFPFYLKFRGGKGFASYFGMTLALNWKLALAVGIAVILLTWITDYIVVGTFATIISVPIYMGISQGWIIALILAIGTVVILYKHRENIPRLMNGTEVGLRSTIRGDNKLSKQKSE